MGLLIDTARQTIGVYRNATSPLRLLPDFLIIGAQKGGTTSLYHYLTEHPNIASARMKEVHFFDQHFRKGALWYRSNFPTAFYRMYQERLHKNIFITGEGSPEYLFYPHPARKVARLLPHIKLIALLRNPVDRAYSQYRHNIRWGHETLSFEDALRTEETRMRVGNLQLQTDKNYHDFGYQRAAYLARGIYADQLAHWLDFFPREQLLIVKSEDFYSDPSNIYKATLAFLGLPAIEPQSLKGSYKKYNQSTEQDGPERMNATLRKQLITYFEPHNDRLYKLLGTSFDWDR